LESQGSAARKCFTSPWRDLFLLEDSGSLLRHSLVAVELFYDLPERPEARASELQGVCVEHDVSA
jgi:hypothetical protein